MPKPKKINHPGKEPGKTLWQEPCQKYTVSAPMSFIKAWRGEVAPGIFDRSKSESFKKQIKAVLDNIAT